jgi:hypothetical protein
MKPLMKSETMRAAGESSTPDAQAQRERSRLVSQASMLGLVFLFVLVVSAPLCRGQEPKSLMTMIAQWQYPNSIVSGATLSDAATQDAAGVRTIQSVQYKALLTTKEPMSKVIEFYNAKLTPATRSAPGKPDGQLAADSGRSVTFHDDSEGRPLAIHVILVNTDKASTTLVISRAATESETHIAWAHYQEL